MYEYLFFLFKEPTHYYMCICKHGIKIIYFLFFILFSLQGVCKLQRCWFLCIIPVLTFFFLVLTFSSVTELPDENSNFWKKCVKNYTYYPNLLLSSQFLFLYSPQSFAPRQSKCKIFQNPVMRILYPTLINLAINLKSPIFSKLNRSFIVQIV